MTEPDWAAAADPEAMLAFAAPQLSDRKLRLYLVGCCRRRWELFTDMRCRHAVEVAERFADGRAAERERATAERFLLPLLNGAFKGRASFEAYTIASAAQSACVAAAELRPGIVSADQGLGFLANAHARRVAAADGGGAARREAVQAIERAAQADLLRCVAGSPFAYTVPDPRWLTAAVLGLARAAYHGRDFAALPILADALEEAGCDDPAVLTHARHHRDHARGCWVLDMLLGKE